MKNKKLIFIAIAAVLLLAAAGAGAWFFLHGHSSKEGEPEKPPVDKHVYKYLSLDKVIVMIRTSAPEGAVSPGAAHYMAVDLVFKAPQEKEKIAKDHLPMLRSVAVKALSSFSYDTANAMTIDQLTAAVNRAYSESYARDGQEKPFTDVMVGKLIIE